MSDTFMKVTNADIYKQIVALDAKLTVIQAATKVNRWIGTTALSLCILLFSYVLASEL